MFNQKEFLRMYKKRLEVTIGKDKSKYAEKVLKFVLKNIAFNVLIGNIVDIHQFGIFFPRDIKTNRYSPITKKIESVEETRFNFKIVRTIKEMVRDASIKA